ncbi:MAG: hypothetical protein E6I86_14500 [Chloroflexi bacterium]|nr:MAG: hypothetical protein E6I86_14500 [Chloroflexota bacterium]
MTPEGPPEEFLVVYDYGQGGVWAYVHARSAEHIEKLFPELKVVRERPGWMTVEMEESIRKNRTVDIGGQTGFLAEILKSRKKRA